MVRCDSCRSVGEEQNHCSGNAVVARAVAHRSVSVLAGRHARHDQQEKTPVPNAAKSQ